MARSILDSRFANSSPDATCQRQSHQPSCFSLTKSAEEHLGLPPMALHHGQDHPVNSGLYFFAFSPVDTFLDLDWYAVAHRPSLTPHRRRSGDFWKYGWMMVMANRFGCFDICQRSMYESKPDTRNADALISQHHSGTFCALMLSRSLPHTFVTQKPQCQKQCCTQPGLT